MVVLLGKVSQNDVGRTAVIVLLEKSCQIAVGKVAIATLDALFDHHGVWPDTQHLQVVVRLDHQSITAAQRMDNVSGHTSQIGQNAHLHPIGLEGEAAGISSIVRSSKW